MEKIENEVEETNLEDNADAYESNDSEGESDSRPETDEGRTLSDSEYQEYRKLKRLSEKGNQEGSQETKSNEVSNSADVEELIFQNAGITSDEARAAAKKLVKLGEAANLMEATKDEFVQMKQDKASQVQAVTEATPTPSRRVPSTRQDTVESWVDRDGLPENQELRFKVIQERRKRRSSQSMFGSPRNVIIK